MNLLDFDDLCLDKICYYCDAETIVSLTETCSRLKFLTERFIKRQTSYACDIDSFEKEVVAVRTLRKVGKYLTRLDLMIDQSYQSSLTNFLLFLAASVGRDFIELSILGEICSMPLHLLSPILSRVELLTLQNTCLDCPSVIDLPLLCPTLQGLIVCGPIIFAPVEKRFRQLNSLDAIFSSEHIPEDVFTQNPQLTCLSLRKREINYITITTLPTNYVNFASFNALQGNLTKLHLNVQLIEAPISRLPELNNFQLLHSLELYSIPEASFNDILKILENLDHLREIVLQCHVTRLHPQFIAIQKSLEDVASKLNELRSFTTVNVDWLEETVTEFVENAEKLIHLDFWSGLDLNYTVTPEFIRTLAEIRRSLNNADLGPLHIKLFTMNADLKQVFQEPYVANMIKLAR